MPVAALNVTTAVLAALGCDSMRIVGILLIAALMVLPVITASRLAWSMRSTILLAMAIGLGSVLSGLTGPTTATFRPVGQSCSSRPPQSSSRPRPGASSRLRYSAGVSRSLVANVFLLAFGVVRWPP